MRCKNVVQPEHRIYIVKIRTVMYHVIKLYAQALACSGICIVHQRNMERKKTDGQRLHRQAAPVHRIAKPRIIKPTYMFVATTSPYFGRYLQDQGGLGPWGE